MTPEMTSQINPEEETNRMNRGSGRVLAPDAQFSETHWKSLLYFSIYRVCLAGLLLALSLVNPAAFPPLNVDQGRAIAGGYFLAMVVALIGARVFRSHFNLQLSLQVLVDVVVFTALIHLSGELYGSLGVMLLVTLTGAGLVGQGPC